MVGLFPDTDILKGPVQVEGEDGHRGGAANHVWLWPFERELGALHALVGFLRYQPELGHEGAEFVLIGCHVGAFKLIAKTGLECSSWSTRYHFLISKLKHCFLE